MSDGWSAPVLSRTRAYVYLQSSTCVISFVRIRYLHLSDDVTWENAESASWSVSEISCGITCANLPTIRPFIHEAMPFLGLGTPPCSKRQPTTLATTASGFGSGPGAASGGGVAKWWKRLTGHARDDADEKTATLPQVALTNPTLAPPVLAAAPRTVVGDVDLERGSDDGSTGRLYLPAAAAAAAASGLRPGFPPTRETFLDSNSGLPSPASDDAGTAAADARDASGRRPARLFSPAQSFLLESPDSAQSLDRILRGAAGAAGGGGGGAGGTRVAGVVKTEIGRGSDAGTDDGTADAGDTKKLVKKAGAAGGGAVPGMGGLSRRGSQTGARNPEIRVKVDFVRTESSAGRPRSRQ